ncbi:MAG: acyl-ACP--UDP-N-acetylglucosamine O-acyltransferase [Chthoniobacterales bacterium]|nr:acyl-ACP--UDP-N-acetylglucosamine O-acyltransferase [Chthoniobacterales bacterium]
MKIHPTAIVADGAVLGADVEIGPGSIVSSRSVLGSGCVLGAYVILENRVVLGDGTKVGHGSILGANPQDLGFDPARRDTGVRIGRGNTIREYVTIHRATKENGDTTVGDGNFIMTGCHLAHDNVVGNGVIMANNALTAGHVHIGDRCFLGGGNVFHQFMRIGTLAMVRGGCRFSKDIPPFLVATGENHVAGINAVGLRRAGFSAEERAEIKRAFRLLYLSGLNISQALEAAAPGPWGARAEELFAFVREAKKRGVCDYAGRGAAEGE